MRDPKNKLILPILSIILLMAGWVACEKEIPYDDIAPESLLVVNGLQHVGEPASLCVEKSSFYINGEKDLRVKDVHADLYVNGVFKETLQVRDSMIMESVWICDDDMGNGHVEEYPSRAFNYCEGTYLLCEGDELRFEVSSTEFDKVAVAETHIPYAPQVISFDTLRTETDSEGQKTLYFSLVIDDAVGKDYYNLYPQEGMEGFVSTDPVFTDFMDIVHVDDLFGGNEYYGRGYFNLFDDSYFDGHPYAVTMTHKIYSESGQYEEPFVVDVSRVDRNLYQYKKSLNTYQTNDFGLLGLFTEPTQVYSNVQNGVGVVAAQSSPVTLRLDFTDN